MSGLPAPKLSGFYQARKDFALSSLVENFRAVAAVSEKAETIIAAWKIWSKHASVYGRANAEAYWADMRAAGLTATEGYAGIKFQEWMTGVPTTPLPERSEKDRA